MVLMVRVQINKFLIHVVQEQCLEFFKVIHAQAFEALHIIAVNIIANLSDYGGKLYTDKQLFPKSHHGTHHWYSPIALLHRHSTIALLHRHSTIAQLHKQSTIALLNKHCTIALLHKDSTIALTSQVQHGFNGEMQINEFLIHVVQE